MKIKLSELKKIIKEEVAMADLFVRDPAVTDKYFELLDQAVDLLSQAMDLAIEGDLPVGLNMTFVYTQLASARKYALKAKRQSRGAAWRGANPYATSSTKIDPAGPKDLEDE